MIPHRLRHSKPKVWSIEPKAPSLVSLSLRDQNIPRPPKRSSSLKAAAAGLKNGFSSHHLLSTSAQDSLQTLRRGKYNSSSSLRLRKTRTRAGTTELQVIEDDEQEDISESVAYGADSSESTASDVLEPFWDQSARKLMLPLRSHEQTVTEQGHCTAFTGSSETVIRSEAPEQSRPSSRLSLSTLHNAPQFRTHSARRLFSKVVGTMQKRKKTTELDQEENDSRVQKWIERATPSRLTSDDVHGTRSIISRRGESSGRGPKIPTPDSTLPQAEQSTFEIPSTEPPLAPGDRTRLPDQQRLYSWATSAVTEGEASISLRHPLRIRIAARAELTEAALTSKDALWTIAQIHVELPDTSACATPRGGGVAVAIVLDNSRLATRKDVKKACLEVMALGASLEEDLDHIGLYCTSGSDLADACLLSVAVPLNLSCLRSKLDEVSHRPRDSFRVQDAFLQAAQALLTLRSQSQYASPRIKEDIVVITSSAFGLSSCFQQDLDGFRVHLVNPSLIPYSNKVRRQLLAMRSAQLRHVRGADLEQDAELANTGSVNGWLIDSSRCISDDCESHKSHSLTDAILHSKLQADAGMISNISITIHEGDDAIIEEVIGDLTHRTLLPGQMVSIPIRVKLDSLASRLSIGSVSDHRSSSPLSMADAISELELSLGNHLSELFEVQVTYNHSFFPENTRLEVRESCWLPRNLPPRRVKQYREDAYEGSIRSTHNCRVQKQTALCIAASKPPAEARRDLEAFAPESLSAGVSSFLDALKRRLKHRVALFADVSFIDYLLASEYVDKSPQARNRRESYEEYLSEFVASHGRGDDDAPDTPATVVRRRARNAQPSTETDEGEARRIWQHIRRTSRPGELPKAENGESAKAEGNLDQHEPHIEEIRSAALKHGRKISTATLRSLAKDMRRRDSSLIEEEDEPEDDVN